MNAYFQQEGKVEVGRQKRKSLTRQGVSTRHSFKNDRGQSVRSINHQRVEAREGVEDIIIYLRSEG